MYVLLRQQGGAVFGRCSYTAQFIEMFLVSIKTYPKPVKRGVNTAKKPMHAFFFNEFPFNVWLKVKTSVLINLKLLIN